MTTLVRLLCLPQSATAQASAQPKAIATEKLQNNVLVTDRQATNGVILQIARSRTHKEKKKPLKTSIRLKSPQHHGFCHTLKRNLSKTKKGRCAQSGGTHFD